MVHGDESCADNSAVCIDSKWQKHIFSGDMVILAVGLKSVNGLAEAVRGKVSECYATGDCVKPRKVFNAIHEGLLIARERGLRKSVYVRVKILRANAGRDYEVIVGRRGYRGQK